VPITPIPLLNPIQRFGLLTNAKCGGTTVKWWFVQSLDLPTHARHALAVARHFGPRFCMHWYRRNPFRSASVSDIVESDRRLRGFITFYRGAYCREALPAFEHSAWMKVAVVRNPYDRVVSGFVDKFCGDDLSLPWVREVIETINKTRKPANSITFGEFVEYLCTVNPHRCNAHWRPQTYVLNRFRIDMHVRLERLRDDILELERRLGLPAWSASLPQRQANVYHDAVNAEPVFHGNWTNEQLIDLKRKTGAFPAKATFYDAHLRARVEFAYRDDFDALPYARLSASSVGAPLVTTSPQPESRSAGRG
jgi:hypothetical protein